MITAKAKIFNEYGIHCRPSVVVSKAALAHKESSIYIENEDGAVADAKVVLALIGLSIHCGQSVTVQVEGGNEQEICDEIVALLQTQFDFPRN